MKRETNVQNGRVKRFATGVGVLALATGVLLGGATAASAQTTNWNGAKNCYNYQVMVASTTVGATTHGHEQNLWTAKHVQWPSGGYRLSGVYKSVWSNFAQASVINTASRSCDY